jgi:hypothetical protein
MNQDLRDQCVHEFKLLVGLYDAVFVGVFELAANE